VARKIPVTVDVPTAIPVAEMTTTAIPVACAVDVPEADPTPAKMLAPVAVATEVPAAEPTTETIELP
jgi:hypothetical protein